MKASAISLIPLLLLNSGCAFSPQAVALKPEIQTATAAVGNGKPVSITVVDERPRSTLGTRGVQGVGAELTVAGNLTDVIRAALIDGLQRQGFKPTMERAADERELRVEIRNLDYRVTMGFWAGTLNTECGLKAVCLRGTARPFEQLYRGEFQETVLVVQGDEANNQYVNTALSRAINSLLQDMRLTQCLAQQ